jgi:hypothetical protein
VGKGHICHFIKQEIQITDKHEKLCNLMYEEMYFKLGVVRHVCNPREESRIQGQSELRWETLQKKLDKCC